MTITTAQIRGARGILNWSQQDLAQRTGISATSIGAIENNQTTPRESTLSTIRKTFETGGIEFIGLDGVRIKNEIINVLEGSDALDLLLDDIYSSMMNTGGEVLIFGLEERVDPKSEEHKKIINHLDRIKKANITERIIVREGDSNFLAPKEYYRWIDREHFSPYPFLLYAGKLAMVSWDPVPKVLIVDSQVFSAPFEKIFDYMWNQAEIPGQEKKSIKGNRV